VERHHDRDDGESERTTAAIWSFKVAEPRASHGNNLLSDRSGVERPSEFFDKKAETVKVIHGSCTVII
jgi:hypothetical protein